MWVQGRLAAALRVLAFKVEQFDVEDQRRIWRDDAARAARPVAELRRDDQGALAADFMVATPSSHPPITLRWPSGNSKGWPRSTELSNFLPLAPS